MTVLVPLTKGYFAIVDDADYSEISEHKWHALVPWTGKVCARRRVYATGQMILMHRQLTDAPPGLDADHANGDTLDNRRENLRIATRSQNQANKRRAWGNTSGFKGVRFTQGKYSARVAQNGKTFYLGTFVDEVAAALAYDEAALGLYGEFACTNKMLGLL